MGKNTSVTPRLTLRQTVATSEPFQRGYKESLSRNEHELPPHLPVTSWSITFYTNALPPTHELEAQIAISSDASTRNIEPVQATEDSQAGAHLCSLAKASLATIKAGVSGHSALAIFLGHLRISYCVADEKSEKLTSLSSVVSASEICTLSQRITSHSYTLTPVIRKIRCEIRPSQSHSSPVGE